MNLQDAAIAFHMHYSFCGRASVPCCLPDPGDLFFEDTDMVILAKCFAFKSFCMLEASQKFLTAEPDSDFFLQTDTPILSVDFFFL